MSLERAERRKYELAWSRQEYRAACHSMQLWRERRDLFPGFRSAADLGCGTGRLFGLWNDLGIDAWGYDIAENAVDPSILSRWRHKFVLGPLWEPMRAEVDFGICTDVMEHIPPERVRDVLRSISDGCREVLFKIAHVPDVCGGGSYHLTVESPDWWLAELGRFGEAEMVGVQVRSGFEDSLMRLRRVA